MRLDSGVMGRQKNRNPLNPCVFRDPRRTTRNGQGRRNCRPERYLWAGVGDRDVDLLHRGQVAVGHRDLERVRLRRGNVIWRVDRGGDARIIQAAASREYVPGVGQRSWAAVGIGSIRGELGRGGIQDG